MGQGKLKYGFLCDGAMFVAGKWTYQGLFDKIYSFHFPFVHKECVLALKFSGPVGPHTFRVVLEDSQGRPLVPELRQPIECKEFADTVVSLNLQGLKFSLPGYYAFKVFLDDNQEAFGAIDFEIVRATPPLEKR